MLVYGQSLVEIAFGQERKLEVMHPVFYGRCFPLEVRAAAVYEIAVFFVEGTPFQTVVQACHECPSAVDLVLEIDTTSKADFVLWLVKPQEHLIDV